MATFSKVVSIPGACDFGCSISPDEILQVSKSKVSVICSRTGFCQASYFLRFCPRLFASCPADGERIAVVYPATPSDGERLVVLGAKTGEVQREFALKSSQSFLAVALGTHLFFVLSGSPNVVFFCQFGEGTRVSMFEFPTPVSHLVANSTEPRFLAVRSDNHLCVVHGLDEKNGPKLGLDMPGFHQFKVLCFTGGDIVCATPFGQVHFLSAETGQATKTVTTPHGSKAVGCTETHGVTKDGILFSVETGEEISNAFDPMFICSCGATVVVFTKTEVTVFESSKVPICTTDTMQPPEPFVAQEFSVDPAVLFATQNAVYGFNILGKDISKFASLQEKVTKIVTCQACVSMIYSTTDGDKIMTFVTGTKKRDEFGIDVMCDRKNRTWILQKDCVLAFERSLLDLKQILKIDLPVGHRFTRIFRIGQTTGLYSPDGVAAYLSPERKSFISFRLQRELSIIQWPAMCTADRLYICTSDSCRYEDLDPRSDYIVLDMNVSSCCWLCRTLFAVEGSTVYAIGQKTGNKRPVAALPNGMCVIAAALPSELIMVTSLPELRTVVFKGPYLAQVLFSDIGPSDLQAFKYMLYHMPSMVMDPSALTGLPPLLAMSVFSKAEPKYVNDLVVNTYSRFAMFQKLWDLAKGNRDYKDILTQIADRARLVGQFDTARLMYQEAGDFESLFELFIITKHERNLAVLAEKSYLAECIEHFFHVAPKDGEFAPLVNLPLPRIREPINSEEFTLYAGDPSDAAPLLSPAFDELEDCCVNSYGLSGDELVAVEEVPAPPEETEPEEHVVFEVQPPAQPAPVEHTPPKDEEEKSSLAKWFEDDEDEDEQKKLTIDIKMTPTAGMHASFALEGVHPGGRRRRATVLTGKRNPFSLDDSMANVSKEAPERGVAPVVPVEDQSQFATMGVVPPAPSQEDNTNTNVADQYKSTLFLD